MDGNSRRPQSRRFWQIQNVNAFIGWLPAASIAAVIFWLSAQAHLPLPPLFPGFDKLAHFLAYAVLSCAVALGWWCSGHTQRWFLLRMSILFASLYGISDEWHQSFVPGREADIVDWCADTAGSVAGAWWFAQWALRRAARAA